jgi:hypothetical protein
MSDSVGGSLYVAAGSQTCSSGRHTTVAWSHLESAWSVATVEPFEARVLAWCQTPRTLEAHASAAWRAGVASDPDVLARALDRLSDLGLLRRFATSEPIDVPSTARRPSVATVAIVTADRPLALRRCLHSLADHCSAFGQRPRILVIDGSRQASARNEVMSCIRALDSPDDVQYVGQRQVLALRQRLEARGIPASIVRHSLCSGATGANRNIALLLTAGSDVLMLDDDVVVRPWCTDGKANGAQLGGHGDLYQWSFFRTRAEAISAAVPAPLDLLDEHGRFLGLSLGGTQEPSSMAGVTSATCAHLIASLAAGRKRRVRLTCAGLAGDSACVPEIFLFQTGSVRRQLTEKPLFDMAMSSREVHHIVNRPTITDDPGCKSYCMGVFNREVSPAFMPAHRNEDGVFGAMLLLCDPNALVTHLPVGVIHDSHRPSCYGRDAERHPRETAASEFVLAFTRTAGAALPAVPVPVRIARLGQLLRDLGSLDAHEFIEVVTDTVLRHRCRGFASFESAASVEGSLPDHWRSALDRYMTIFHAAIRRRGFFCPVEYRHRRSLAEGFAAMQRFVRDFGELLTVWPEMWTSEAVSPAAATTSPPTHQGLGRHDQFLR